MDNSSDNDCLNKILMAIEFEKESVLQLFDLFKETFETNTEIFQNISKNLEFIQS